MKSNYRIFTLQNFVVENDLGLPSGSIDSVAVKMSPDGETYMYLDLKLKLNQYDELVKRHYALENAYKYRKYKRGKYDKSTK